MTRKLSAETIERIDQRLLALPNPAPSGSFTKIAIDAGVSRVYVSLRARSKGVKAAQGRPKKA